MRRLALAAALALSIAPPPAAADDDFEDDAPTRSLALGPVPSSTATLSVDAGWLRSGARVDLGLAVGLDLTLRGETFALHSGLDGQNAGFVGLRFSPLAGPGLRLSLSGEAGLLFVPARVGTLDVLVLRAELVVGTEALGFLPYLRAAVRGLRHDAAGYDGWDRDGEVAAGLERAVGQVLLGAEASAWIQPVVSGLFQWRLRAGVAF